MKYRYKSLDACRAAWEVARLAIAAFGGQVGQRSAEGCGKTRLSIARLGAPVDITRLQVPPRPPKKKDIRLDVFLFCMLELKGRPSVVRRKVSGGHFLVRGKVHEGQNAPGTGVG